MCARQCQHKSMKIHKFYKQNSKNFYAAPVKLLVLLETLILLKAYGDIQLCINVFYK